MGIKDRKKLDDYARRGADERETKEIDRLTKAIDAITDHRTKGDLSDGLVYDAVRVRLIESVVGPVPFGAVIPAECSHGGCADFRRRV